MKKFSLISFVVLATAMISNFIIAPAQNKATTGVNLADGQYIIRLASNPSFVIGAETNRNVRLYSYNGSNTQKWNLSHKNNAIVLTNVANNVNVMDAYDGKVVNGSNIVVNKKNGNNSQCWFVEKYGNGYLLRNAANRNYVVDLDHAKIINGQNILLWGAHKGVGQIWTLEKVSQKTTVQSSQSKITQDLFNKKNNSKVQPQQVQRKVVKQKKEYDVYGGYSEIKEYNDGWIETRLYTKCIQYCEHCSGTGQIMQPLGIYKCGYCTKNKGKCSICKGSGYRLLSKKRYLSIKEIYSDGISGFYFYYFDYDGVLSSLSQGTKHGIVPENTKLVDAGDYWKFGSAKISKDLQTLIYNNKTYKKCSSAEYQRLYGEEIRKSNENYWKAVQMTGGGIRTSSDQSTGTGDRYREKQCHNCCGTGRVLDLAYSCPVHGVCSAATSAICRECGKNHCVNRQAHKYCGVCEGKKVIRR